VATDHSSSFDNGDLQVVLAAASSYLEHLRWLGYRSSIAEAARIEAARDRLLTLLPADDRA